MPIPSAFRKLLISLGFARPAGSGAGDLGGADAPGLGAEHPPVPSNGGRRSRFNLSACFGVVSLAAIAAIAAASVSMLGWFVTQRMLWQEGTLTREFVHSLVLVEPPLLGVFGSPDTAPPAAIQQAFEHLSRMPDVLRANLYDATRRVIWSSDEELNGRRFGPNDELDRALAGHVVVEKKTADQRRHGKAEYEALRQRDELFVEIYVPVVDPASGRVVGAVEFYKNPRALTAILAELRRNMLVGAIAFGALLFAALFGLVRRADRLIRTQQRAIVENETFAALGELSSVVAHGIRNPLAAIRSSAELILAGERSDGADAARDIVEQSDRLGAWLRELLAYTRPAESAAQPVALEPLVRSCLREAERACERKHVGASALLPDALPPVRGDALALGQVLRSLLANAIDAVPEGGRIVVHAGHDARAGEVTLRVQDNGPGMNAEQRRAAGRPLFTTKRHGMGVGLALARRVVERSGGRLHIESEPGRGTTVEVVLRAA